MLWTIARSLQALKRRAPAWLWCWVLALIYAALAAWQRHRCRQTEAR